MWTTTTGGTLVVYFQWVAKSSPADKQLSNFYLSLQLLQLGEVAEDLIQKEIEAEKAGIEHDCILPDMPEEDLDSIFNSLLKIWTK